MKKAAAAAATKYYSYYYRQGDILLERIYEIPKQIMNHHHQHQQTQDNYVIAHGESGNQHRMSKHVLIFENPENKGEERYVQILSQDTFLEHQEHKSIPIPQGIYKIRREREYNAFESAIRQVYEVLD